MTWDQPFFDPIVLEGRKPLVTLRYAAEYITELPNAEHDADEWQAAMQMLLLVAELDGPAMFARIGIMKALNREVEGKAQAEEGPMTPVWIYVDTSKEVGDPDHLKVFRR